MKTTWVLIEKGIPNNHLPGVIAHVTVEISQWNDGVQKSQSISSQNLSTFPTRLDPFPTGKVTFQVPIASLRSLSSNVKASAVFGT